ncbi:MAG: hypothetical protein OQJ96_01860 [Flavobacteriales bacterium]|nr:hypothetical protein [Flavobacteriales bacterium]MCW8912669.1 hypothetical protein [Flavobacteriales bacterium]MCW8938274.1 hypothetical protein [Flavobacteriales bacterium]MCW8940166.1 hypothetical protein [Flavobacteriales bacterium]MCW8967369.1 hypothetical protein [Flavobacteriales bacterium]
MRQVLLVLIVLVLGCSDNKSETDDVSKVEVDNETILNEIKNKLSGLWVIERGHLDYMAVVIDENFLTITTEPNNFLRVHEFQLLDDSTIMFHEFYPEMILSVDNRPKTIWKIKDITDTSLIIGLFVPESPNELTDFKFKKSDESFFVEN